MYSPGLSHRRREGCFRALHQSLDRHRHRRGGRRARRGHERRLVTARSLRGGVRGDGARLHHGGLFRHLHRHCLALRRRSGVVGHHLSGMAVVRLHVGVRVRRARALSERRRRAGAAARLFRGAFARHRRSSGGACPHPAGEDVPAAIPFPGRGRPGVCAHRAAASRLPSAHRVPGHDPGGQGRRAGGPGDGDSGVARAVHGPGAA